MAIRLNLELVPEKFVFKTSVKLTLCHEVVVTTNKWTVVEDRNTGQLIDIAQGDLFAAYANA